MTNRERVLAILSYGQYDRMPIVDFGFNEIALEKWRREGHITEAELADSGGDRAGKTRVEQKLGFDFNWQGCLMPLPNAGVLPSFERKVLKTFPDGTKHVVAGNGNIEGIKEGISCIPQDIGTLLENRKAWEELYLPKLQYSAERIADLVNSDLPPKK
jgi:uroporphyrinogen decarboxylase